MRTEQPAHTHTQGDKVGQKSRMRKAGILSPVSEICDSEKKAGFGVGKKLALRIIIHVTWVIT